MDDRTKTAEEIAAPIVDMAMTAYHKDNDTDWALKTLDDAREGALRTIEDSEKRREVCKILRNHWRAISLHANGIDDLFRSA